MKDVYISQLKLDLIRFSWRRCILYEMMLYVNMKYHLKPLQNPHWQPTFLEHESITIIAYSWLHSKCVQKRFLDETYQYLPLSW